MGNQTTIEGWDLKAVIYVYKMIWRMARGIFSDFECIRYHIIYRKADPIRALKLSHFHYLRWRCNSNWGSPHVTPKSSNT